MWIRNTSSHSRLRRQMQQPTDLISNQSLTSPPVGAHVLPPPSPALPCNVTNTVHPINIRFTREQLDIHQYGTPESRQLKRLINEKIKNKEFFYGIEILARSYHPNTTLDYSAMGPLLPLFTSIVWLSMEYWMVPKIDQIEAIQLAQHLNPNTIVMPHFSCYHLEDERLKEFLNLNFSNVLAIRGDQYRAEQSYKHSSELVEAMRKIRGDSITIAVGGYPEGHPESGSVTEDMDNLSKKVSTGADFIITQICFSAQAVIEFIQRCREAGIDIPIVVGIFVPDNMRMLEAVLRITKIRMPPEDLSQYRERAALGDETFTNFAVDKAVQMIDAVMNADDIDIYGLQFFSMNKFRNIPKVLEKIVKK